MKGSYIVEKSEAIVHRNVTLHTISRTQGHLLQICRSLQQNWMFDWLKLYGKMRKVESEAN